MAELKIPQKTLQDNFNLQDFKDDFNALNSEIAENKSELNSEITNNVNELNSKIDTNKSLTDSEISRLKEIANTWETFKNTGGAINGDIAIEKHLANLKIGDSFNIKTYDQNTELSSDWNKSIVLRIRSNATDSASYVRLNRANFAGNGNISLGEESTPWTNVYLKGVLKESSGYTKLPNGLIMQWGDFEMTPSTTSNSYSYTISFPITFSTTCLSIIPVAMTQITKDNWKPENCAFMIHSWGLDNFVMKLNQVASQRYVIRWIAIGY